MTSAIVVDSDAREMATTISSAKVERVLPTEFALKQNRPNPFNPSTEISFSLPKPAEVTLVIYNVLGENVVTLAEGLRAAGTHAVMWDGRDNSGSAVASGVYFYRLDAGEFCATRKMLLLK
ncbi:MAG: T9SS type A sorting domain-containing protein [candidate division Zixibacteria bacterium]|nr:T9SS type A sorting domain-containing protein [candidate division Zixibacteria bacterium]